MFAARRTRRIFRFGGMSFEHAKFIAERKGIEMVNYLRARRAIHVRQQRWAEYAARSKRWHRREYFKNMRRSAT